MDEKLMVRPIEAVKLTGYSRATIYRMAANGILPSVRSGRNVRIPVAALRRWIEQNTTGGTPHQVEAA